MSDHATLTAALRNAAARMAHAETGAQYDAARAALDTLNAQTSDDA